MRIGRYWPNTELRRFFGMALHTTYNVWLLVEYMPRRCNVEAVRSNGRGNPIVQKVTNRWGFPSQV